MDTQTGKVRAKRKQSVDRGTIDDPLAFGYVPDPLAYPSHTILRGVSVIIFTKSQAPKCGEVGYVGMKNGKCMIGRVVIKASGAVVVVTDVGPLQAHVFAPEEIDFMALAIERREKLPRRSESRSEKQKTCNGIPIYSNEEIAQIWEDERIIDAISCAAQAPDVSRSVTKRYPGGAKGGAS